MSRWPHRCLVTMRPRALVLGLIVLTAGLTGCIGSDGGEGDGSGDDPIEPGSTPDGDENETTPATTERAWERETFNGTVTGFNVPGVGSGNVAPASENMQVTFQASSGIDVLYLNLTAEGGELRMNIADPDCQPGAFSTCEEQVETSGGEASYANETATSGEWNVRIFSNDPVAVQVSYTLSVVQGVNATSSP